MKQERYRFMTAETGSIDRLAFSKEGFEELKYEVKVLVELVTEMTALLTPEQKDAINAKQNKRHMSADEYTRYLQERRKEPAGSLERTVRIRRLLHTK